LAEEAVEPQVEAVAVVYFLWTTYLLFREHLIQLLWVLVGQVAQEEHLLVALRPLVL
jgi:hypothetical protein